MDVQLVRPRPQSLVARSSGTTGAAEPEKLPEDRYRPLHLGKKAARVAGWSAPIAGGVLGYMAAQSTSGWAGLAVGAPLGLALGLVVGGATDLLKSLGSFGGKRGVGKATVIGTLVGGAITGGLSAWLVSSGVGWGMPVMAGVGAVQGLAIAGVTHLLTRSEPTEAERLVRNINEDPAKYKAPQATPYLDAVHSLEKKGWSVRADGLLEFMAGSNPNAQAHLARKNEGENDIPIAQLPKLLEVMNGLEDPLLSKLGSAPLISEERAKNPSWGGVPDRSETGWWQVEKTRAYHDLKAGRAVHYAHREVTFTYDPLAPPPLDEFVQDARTTAQAYDQSFRRLLDDGALSRQQGQALCNTMVSLVDNGRYPDLASAGQAMARYAELGDRPGEAGTAALVALMSPGRPRETTQLMDALVPVFGLEDTLKAANYLESRLPMLSPADQPGARDRFVRLASSLGEVKDAIRMDGIIGALSAPVYDDYLKVCEELSASGGDREARDLLFDFAMLGAYAAGPDDLNKQAASFARLLEPLAAQGKADQAAPVYAMLRTGRQSVDAYLEALKATGDVDRAREQLCPRGTGAASTAVVDGKQYEPALGWKSREAVSHLEDQRSRLDAPGFERYQKTFNRLVNASGDLDTARRASGVLQYLPPDRCEAHLKVVDDLARRRGSSVPEVLEDYLCAVAGRLPGQTLEEGAREYGMLLGGCAGAGYPGEAAPTFALIRAGVESGQAGKDTVETLTDRYVKTLMLTKDGEKARRLLFVADSSSSVQEDKSGVTVGGIRIRRRPRE